MQDPYIWPPTRPLEQVAREIATEWGMTLGARFAMSRFAYTAPLDGYVLKITPPEDDQADLEPDALRSWDGRGAVRVLRHDPRRRAMLLERIDPGYDASTVDEHEAVSAVLDVGKRLWQATPDPRFRSARTEVARALDRHASTHPLGDVAQQALKALDPREEVLLHGDLHHHNLLRGRDGWVAVDPKPLVGEREFDLAAFLWNPVSQRPTPERTAGRMGAFVSAGIDGDRLRAWTIVRGVVWDLPFSPEDPTNSRAFAVVSQLLERR
jgi:streptomycin 6-kinase